MSTAKENKYTPAILEAMKAAAPLTKEKAESLAVEFGEEFTARSIIAKAIREGIEYQNAAPVVKKPKGESKADVLAQIEAKLGAELPGLLKAPLADLRKLADTLAEVVAQVEPVADVTE
jgi:hypothetical protein